MFKIKFWKTNSLENVKRDILYNCMDGKEFEEQGFVYLDVEFEENDPKNENEFPVIEVVFNNGQFKEIAFLDDQWEYEIQFTDEEKAYIKNFLIDAGVFERSNQFKKNPHSFMDQETKEIYLPY